MKVMDVYEITIDGIDFKVIRLKDKNGHKYLVKTIINNMIGFRSQYEDSYSLSIFFREVGRVVTGYYSIIKDEDGSFYIKKCRKIYLKKEKGEND